MLNNEQKAKLVEAASQLNQVEEPPSDTLRVDATTGTESGGEVVEDVKVESVKVEEPTESVEVEASTEQTDDSPAPKRGHNVPYSRFKNVLEGRNKFRSEVNSYKEQLSSLEQKLANLEQSRTESPSQKAPVESGNWLDDFLADDDVQASSPQWKNQYDSLDQRLYKFEVAQEEKALRVELDTIAKDFPAVPEKLLLQAVIKDPKVDMRQIAQDYHAYVSGIEESAIARYVEANSAAPVVEEVEAAPRPRSTGSRPGRSVSAPAKSPTSIKDASSALRDLLKKDNPFR